MNMHLPRKTCSIAEQIVCYLVLLLMTAACSRPLPEQEAKKFLRAFDNEVMQLAGRMQKTPASQAMWQLLSLKKAPLPSMLSANPNQKGSSKPFDFNENKGLYSYNAIGKAFVKTVQSDSIIIDFPYLSEHDTMARFVVTDYAEEATSLQLLYPIRIQAFLIIGNKVVMTLHHQGSVGHGVPVSGQMTVDFSEFSLRSVFKNKLFRGYGKVTIDVSLWSFEKQILQSVIQSKITVGADNSLVYNTLDMDIKMYPIQMKLFIDREAMDRNTKQFNEDFNRHSTIKLYTLNSNQFIGDIRLMDKIHSDKLNPAIVYNNHSFEFLEDFLLSIQKIMNVKM